MIERICNAVNKGIHHLIQIPYRTHLMIGLGIRVLLIIYSHIQDSFLDVKYTDVDYRVYTDAARYVVQGLSPYERHTYRYSPIIAWLMIPNVILFDSFGKCLFAVFDIMITMIIKMYVQRQLHGRMNAAKVATYSSLFWLYNPLSIVVSTRGNADSFSCFFILLSLYFLHSYKIKNNINYALSGFFLGVSIHLRLYPVVFSLPMCLSLGDFIITRNTSLREGLVSLIPNRKQLTLTSFTVVTIVALTYSMHMMYGYKFLFETYIYHLFRKDTRHNFSIFFYTSYLTMMDVSFDVLKFTAQVFVALILFLLSLAFGCDYQTLPFAMFCQSAVLVTYNSVVTSQYFLWFMSLLPLIVHDIRMTLTEGQFLVVTFAAGQVSWLFFAYLLEFNSQPVFILLWGMATFFFISNIRVLYQLIVNYSPGYSYGIAYGSARFKNK